MVSEDFSPGLNVLIGLNATGKTQLMKLMYALPVSWATSFQEAPADSDVLKTHLRKKLAGTFQPEEGDIGRLVRRPHRAAHVRLHSERSKLQIVLNRGGEIDPQPPPSALQPSALFIPSRETLAMYEGFAAAYESRELSFGETYYDLCRAMSATHLRSNHLGRLGLVGGAI